jgi:hypothetical protein
MLKQTASVLLIMTLFLTPRANAQSPEGSTRQLGRKLDPTQRNHSPGMDDNGAPPRPPQSQIEDLMRQAKKIEEKAKEQNAPITGSYTFVTGIGPQGGIELTEQMIKDRIHCGAQPSGSEYRACTRDEPRHYTGGVRLPNGAWIYGTCTILDPNGKFGPKECFKNFATRVNKPESAPDLVRPGLNSAAPR